MCGRYTLTEDVFKIQVHFGADMQSAFGWKPRFNIAPTQLVPVVYTENGKREVALMRWGLIPNWANDESIGNRMINARAETLSGKPAFRKSFEKRRCIIPADSFYEWRKEKSARIPLRVIRREGPLLGFAGLWDEWRSPGNPEPIRSFTIITTPASQLLRSLHDRMPAIISEENYALWLDPENSDLSALSRLLIPYESGLTTYEVSRSVNSSKNDSPECVAPVRSA